MIAVVDDDPQIRTVLLRILERAGHRCIGAADAASALALLDGQACELVLCDLVMPASSGLDLLRELRTRYPELPVVMVSGVHDPAQADAAHAQGAYGYLTKPFTPTQVEIAVANALRRSDLERAHRQHRAELEGLVAERTAALDHALGELQAVERMKGELLSRVGHEFRTPITAVVGYGAMLARRPVDPGRAQEFGTAITEAGRQLLRIFEILEFSTASVVWDPSLDLEPIDVGQVLDDVVEATRSRRRPTADADADADRHRIVEHRRDRPLPLVRGDARSVHMAIDELVANAIKFSPDGGVVEVGAARSVVGTGPSVEVTVADRGIGIDPDHVDLATDAFVQGDGSDTRSFGGLGLGLSLVLQVARAHHGHLACESRAGGGTTFRLVLPVDTRIDVPSVRR